MSPLGGPIAERVAAVEPTLALFPEGGRFALCQRRRVLRPVSGFLDGTLSAYVDEWVLVTRFDALDQRIVAAVERMRWFADHGGLLDEIDRSNDLVEEAREKAGRDDITETLGYYYDLVAEHRHFGVDGLAGAARPPAGAARPPVGAAA